MKNPAEYTRKPHEVSKILNPAKAPRRKEKMTEKEKKQFRRKWRRWLKRIGYDLGELLTSRLIFIDMLKIVEANKKIQNPPSYLNWIVDNYAARVALGVRRLVDGGGRDKRAISLYRLIEDIENNKEAVDRSYYVFSYKKRAKDGGFADRNFNRFADEGSNFVSASKLKKDLGLLKTSTGRICTFANQWIAHTDLKKSIRKIPTFDDVHKALDIIDEVFCKYYLLLTRGGSRTRGGPPPYNWKEPLRHPWIELTEQEKQRQN